MTPRELSLCTGARIDRATEWLPHVLAAMDEFEINTPARQAAFLAQIGHESGGLHWATELWGPTAAQTRYEGRLDLGNTEPGDGPRFRGRGLIQTTGRANYQAVSDALGVDFVATPEALAEPVNASRSAGYFWKKHDLNEVADIGDFINITKKINGGTNGLADREALWGAAKGVLGC